MTSKLNYAELDELLYYARLEAQFAERSVLDAADKSERLMHTERYANAKYLEQKLTNLRAKAKGDRHGHLLVGAEIHARHMANRDGRNVVHLSDFKAKMA